MGILKIGISDDIDKKRERERERGEKRKQRKKKRNRYNKPLEDKSPRLPA